MKIYDISMDIHKDMTVYKNKEEKKPRITVAQDHKTGSSYTSYITMEMHTGTHIDAPLHMIDGGSTMELYDLEKFIRKCKVFDFTNVEDKITEELLQKKNIEKDDFILLKTRNSFVEDFDFQFVYLEKSGAAYLKEVGISGVGIDALGIERDQGGHETHKALLGQGIIIMEGLRLKEVAEGEYILCAPPLKIRNVEAAPTRALLIKDIPSNIFE
ncbi:MAG: putative metal-dependent hydrolase [Anaerosolibacter sp.]|jgi:arylformamidase|uniref:cyclase family protein n=1 Tax=Anaerosolibacter sp. TaxID=1872527 RepID=UPI0026094E00|nr:cyclase family protein [Anaerosolibacter sp.]MDF2547635.1 putative metal-dependent hydrolase [Anaerosolibacter sp.]